MEASEVTVRLTTDELASIDRAVAAGRFVDRGEALRFAVRRALDSQTTNETVAESYRRAYGEQPEEPSTGELGIRLLDDRVRRESGAA